jgi:hypothetical protein
MRAHPFPLLAITPFERPDLSLARAFDRHGAAVAVDLGRNCSRHAQVLEALGPLCARAQPGLPAPAKHLNGDPECSKHWRTQIGALHPGYPECSRPLDRDIGPLATVFWGAQSPDSQRGPAIVRRGNRAVELAGGHSPYFQVIRPERHHSAPAHENVVRRLMLVWKLYFQLRHYRKLYGL